MKVLLLDNYDSFTYNLVQIVEQILGTDIDVIRNDEISLEEVQKYDKIILSPGPGVPSEAGNLIKIIQLYSKSKSILGVCLGQQAIVEAFGGQIYNLQNIYHGIATPTKILNREAKILRDIPDDFLAGRYHSWAIDYTTLPEMIEVTSVDVDNIPMSIQHTVFDVHAVQFHPESVLTPEGKKLIKNFLMD